MKKRKIFAILLSLLMVVSLVAACGGDDSADDAASDSDDTVAVEDADSGSEDAAAEGDISISVILKTTASEYWGYVMAGALSYMDDNPDVFVEVVGAANETAFDEQLSMIETALGSDAYDGFVISPLQGDMVATTIEGSDKPIIAIDTDIPSDKVLSFVGTGNEEAAKLGGETAVEVAEERGWEELKAICITGVQGDTTAQARIDGYKQGVEAAGGIFLDEEIQYADATTDKAVNSMEAIMQKYPEGIAMILCNNDDMALGASRAAAGNEAYKDTVFVGFDGVQSACNAILAGEQTLSVAQDAYGMGYLAVEAAHKAIMGEELDDFIDSGASMITPENAQEQLDKLKGYLGE
ncbi:MAG: substrate-binding domain-containing protein [Clostridiaceae bacterium]|nr:substrate-binding domain-containing protein [Clostridiaceae bacterium]